VVTLAGPALRPGGMGSPSHLPPWLIPGHTPVVGALVQVRKWYDGPGWFVAGAVLLLVFAALVLLVGLQSPDRVLWTGQEGRRRRAPGNCLLLVARPVVFN
jgi:hypothetical protein